MSSVKTAILTNLSNLILLLFAALSFAVVLDARDPVGFLGWMFCLATVLTVSCKTPVADAP